MKRHRSGTAEASALAGRGGHRKGLGRGSDTASVAQSTLRVLLREPLTTYGHAVRSSGRA